MSQIVKGGVIACVLAMFSISVYAHNNVVVIPMGGDTSTKKTVFITSTVYTGDLVSAANALDNVTGLTDGLTAGDALCQSRADAAGLDGTYKAWLSTSSFDAIRMLSETAGPWYRTDGVKVGDFGDIVNELLEAPVDRNEYGNEVPNWAGGSNVQDEAWTGTGGDNGTRYDNTGDYTCNDWTDATDAYSGTVGDAFESDVEWTEVDDEPCDFFEFPLYCFEY